MIEIVILREWISLPISLISLQKLTKIRDLDIYANAQSLEGVELFKYLGVTVQQNMSWYDHVNAISTKIIQRLGILQAY